MMDNGPLPRPLVDIPQMAEKARDMLGQALDAFVQRDVEKARSIPTIDDDVDELYNRVYRRLMTAIVTSPQSLDQANYLLWAAHNLERAADRVSNICERVVFMVTGQMVELDAT
jgi:phosphate transport system protein